MAATEPDQVIRLFADYFNAGDLPGLGSLYEADALIIPDPSQGPVSGVPAIKEALGAFVAMGGRLTIVASQAYCSGDIALTHSTWRLEPPGADPMEATSAEVARRQPDGSWKYVIDNPWGAGVLAALTHSS
jgi:ketosteroid isomerase-like protein